MKNKILKIISNILLIGNLFCGFLFIGCFFSGHWYLSPLPIVYMILAIKFHLFTYKDEHDAYEKWEEEFKKTHTYLGEEPYGGDVWENKLTGKIIYQ